MTDSAGHAPDPRYAEFPTGFFGRSDPSDDAAFYAPPRLVTHIDDGAIAAVGALYGELGFTGRVLDVMSSWISHFDRAPDTLVALGRNATELRANRQAEGALVADLNRRPVLPFRDASFDSAVCCVSVDYLVRPLEVFDEMARVLRPGGTFCCSFSNRCFPTKAIAGWLASDDAGHVQLVTRYFELSRCWTAITSRVVIGPGSGSDPLYAVWATAGEA